MEVKNIGMYLMVIISFFIIAPKSFSQTPISGDITYDTRLGPTGFPADSVYLINSNLNVYGTHGPDNITTLIIEPGVTLIFGSGTPNFNIGYSSQPGQIIAQGTPSNRITFTSNNIYQTHGKWGCMALSEYSRDCILENVDILYGGYDWYGYHAALNIFDPDGSNLVISNCNISNSKTNGIYIDDLAFDVEINNVSIDNCLGDGIIHNASSNNALISFNDCDFTNNGGNGITFNNNDNILLQNCTFDNNSGNAISCFASQVGGINDNNSFLSETMIEVKGGTISDDSYWNNFSITHDVSYLISDGIRVAGTAGPDGITTLQIEAGSKLLFDPLPYDLGLRIGYQGLGGQLIAQGSASERIIFGSAAQTPAAGDWSNINLDPNSRNCIFEYVDILYGGSGSNVTASLVNYSTGNSSFNMSNCNIMYSSSSGIKFESEEYDINMTNNSFSGNQDYGVIHTWSDTSTRATYTNCLFADNGESGVIFDYNESILITNCTFLNNGESAIECLADHVKYIDPNNIFTNEKCIKVLSAYVTKDVTWHDFNVPYYIESDFGITGFDGPDLVTSLTLEPGTKLIFNDNALTVGTSGKKGQLIAKGNSLKRITFTSADENPSPGDWKGIVISNNAKNCILDYVDILYGGKGISGVSANLSIYQSTSPNCNITNSKIESSYTDGIVIFSPPDNLIINYNTIANNNRNGVTLLEPDNMVNCTWNNIFNNGGYGVMNETFSWLDASNCYWGSDDGPGGVGPGTGDEVSSYVKYGSWLPGPLPVNTSEVSVTESPINFFPNPAFDHIQINTTAKYVFPLFIKIYNTSSQILISETVIDNNSIINLSKLISGTYYINCQDRKGNDYSSVLIIRK